MAVSEDDGSIGTLECTWQNELSEVDDVREVVSEKDISGNADYGDESSGELHGRATVE